MSNHILFMLENRAKDNLITLAFVNIAFITLRAAYKLLLNIKLHFQSAYTRVHKNTNVPIHIMMHNFMINQTMFVVDLLLL